MPVPGLLRNRASGLFLFCSSFHLPSLPSSFLPLFLTVETVSYLFLLPSYILCHFPNFSIAVSRLSLRSFFVLFPLYYFVLSSPSQLWNIEAEACMGIFRGHSGWLHFVAFSVDGKKIVTASSDETCKVGLLWGGAGRRRTSWVVDPSEL